METVLYQRAMTYFRTRRNAGLSHLIVRLKKPVRVLDVGGTRHFWNTVSAHDHCNIKIINLDGDCGEVADARDLSHIADKSYDLVVSNSLIEHVGQWADIKDACSEIRRVGKHGWVQTPSPLFPIEPHLLLPCIHWLSPNIQRWLLTFIPARGIRTHDPDEIRNALEGINLISKAELRLLFPECQIRTEWFLVPKSHIVVW